MSILTSIKKLLGISEEYEHFDTDIIIHINTALMALRQMGVGPEKGFVVKDKESKWTDIIPENNLLFEDVKTYVYIKVKLIFDPPLSSSTMEALKQTASEIEWRINHEVDYNVVEEVEQDA